MIWAYAYSSYTLSELWAESLGADWGASDWSEDVDRAEAYADELWERVADAKAWSEAWRGVAGAMVDSAASHDPEDSEAFWLLLYTGWAGYSESVNAPDGWNALGATFAQAAGTSATVAEARELATIGAQVGGAMDETITDLTDPRQSWIPWAIGAGVIAALFVVSR